MSRRVGHAELKFGPYTVMVSDEYPEYGIEGPEEGRATGSSIHLHVDDVDAFTEQAVLAGATLTMKPADQFHGERSSKVIDPYGHEWYLGSKIEGETNGPLYRPCRDSVGWQLVAFARLGLTLAVAFR